MFLRKYSKYRGCVVCMRHFSQTYHLHHTNSDSATGKEYRQVPYSHEDMRVDGLPPGVNFCNPRLYSRHQLECIMNTEQSITFVMSNPGKLSDVRAVVCTCIVDNVLHVEHSIVMNVLCHMPSSACMVTICIARPALLHYI